MGRVLHTESKASQREKLLRYLALAIRQASQPQPSPSEIKDLIAFCQLSLHQIYQGVNESAQAWEKRGYWVKADHFRRDWEWAHRAHKELEEILHEGDLTSAGSVMADIAGEISQVKPYKRPPVSKPWEGAWEVWKGKFLQD